MGARERFDPCRFQKLNLIGPTVPDSILLIVCFYLRFGFPKALDMGTPPAEELMKKIQELEADQAQLKQEMSRLKLSDSGTCHHARQRSHSTSPVRTRLAPSTRRRRGGEGFEAPSTWRQGSTSFSHSSPLQRESRSLDTPDEVGGADSGPAASNFTDNQYLNILQSMGQSVHIIDLGGRIVYW